MRWPWQGKPESTPQPAVRMSPQLTRFSIDADDIIGWEDFPWLEFQGAQGIRIPREVALAVPPVLKARNLIVGAISTMPLCSVDRMFNPVRVPLLEQIDPDTSNVVTKAQTIEDLLFEGIAWWRVLARDATGYPYYARHVEARQVSTQIPSDFPINRLPSDYRPGSHVFVQGEPVPTADMKRFDSPNPPLLVAAARPIRRLLKLVIQADKFADSPAMRNYFQALEGGDPEGDSEDDEGRTKVQAFLDGWQAERRVRATGYVPEWLELKDASVLTPADLQLQQLIAAATLDIANATGLDPEDLGLSTTSRTYKNQIDARQDRINESYSSYSTAFDERLSMPDITVRGTTVRTDWDGYLKANPLDRMTIQTGYHAAEIITRDEVRNDEGMPNMTPEQEMSFPVAQPQITSVPAAKSGETLMEAQPAPAGVGPRFNADAGLVFDTEIAGSFSTNEGRREITGLVMPWGAIGRSGGRRYKFNPGSLRYNAAHVNRIKLLIDHDQSQPVGRLVRTWADDAGQWATFKVARGEQGDRALAMAADGLRDGLSAGIAWDHEGGTFAYSADPTDGTISLVSAAPWAETSLVSVPSFAGARVSDVAFTSDQWEGIPAMPCSKCGQVHAPSVACPTNQPTDSGNTAVTYSADQVQHMIRMATGQPIAQSAPTNAPTVQTAATFSAEQVVEMMQRFSAGQSPTQHQQGPQVPQIGQQSQFSAGDVARMMNEAAKAQPPATVDPTSRQTPTPAPAAVNETPLYRFDGGKAQRVFSADLAAAASGNAEARQIVERFMADDMAAMFTNITPANVATLNPVPTRPELFVPNLSFPRPLGDLVTTGPLNDLIAFIVPQYSSSSGLAGTHTPGTEPTAGAFATTSQTITPKGVSGRVDIDREIIDSGGSPQADQLIYSEMVRAYNEVLETRIVDMFQALSLSDVDLTGVDSVLQANILTVFGGLQYLRGGDRFSALALSQDLYTAVLNAVDDAGRLLFPSIAPQNAAGTVASDLSNVRIGSKVGVPAWATATANGGNNRSFLFVPSSVYQWVSAPRRFTFDQVNVSSVAIAIWGYSAEATLRASDVKQLEYSGDSSS